MKKEIPWRTKMMPDSWYLKLDRGIRFAVRVLHARGFETCQSCQGGAWSLLRPTYHRFECNRG